MFFCNRCKFNFNKESLIKGKKCFDHYYCLKCRSILKARKESISNCRLCENHYNRRPSAIEGYAKKFLRSCIFCREIKPDYISICHDHRICFSCLSAAYPSREINSHVPCKICREILSKSCRECSVILEDNERFFKRDCRSHIYCRDCVRLVSSKNRCADCDMIRESLSQDDRNVSREVIEPIRNDVSKVHQKNLQTLNCCQTCGGGSGQKLECGHIFCFGCIVMCFREDLKQFIGILLEKNFKDVYSKDCCFRCPEKCCIKYIYPFDISLIEDIFSLYKNSSHIRRLVLCCSSYFEGIKYIFFECPNCSEIAGSIAQYRYCFNCQYEDSILN